MKPRWRGVSHQYAALAAAVAALTLVVTAPGLRAQLATLVYGLTLVGLFAASALYHRPTWSPASRRWLRGLDHAMIFLIIAGTYTPVALLAVPGGVPGTALVAVWAVALAGAGWQALARGGSRWVMALVCVALGWAGLVTVPAAVTYLPLAALTLFALGGVLYSVGALVYARRWPDPDPAVFGYHEVFHLFVIVAAALHYAAIALYVIPRG
jgi:hemolysin III